MVPWSGPQGAIPLGPYVMVRLLPMEDGEPHYRVRSSVDGHERALLESQIMLPEERLAKVEPPPAKPAQRSQVKGRSAADSRKPMRVAEAALDANLPIRHPRSPGISG